MEQVPASSSRPGKDVVAAVTKHFLRIRNVRSGPANEMRTRTGWLLYDQLRWELFDRYIEVQPGQPSNSRHWWR